MMAKISRKNIQESVEVHLNHPLNSYVRSCAVVRSETFGFNPHFRLTSTMRQTIKLLGHCTTLSYHKINYLFINQ
jgi:hypothetical protein